MAECCAPARDERHPLLSPAAVREIAKEEAEAIVKVAAEDLREEMEEEENSTYVDDLLSDFLEPKGLFLLMWADEKPANDATKWTRRAIELFNVWLVWGISVGVPMILLDKEKPGDKTEDGTTTHYCKGDLPGAKESGGRLASSATLLFMYLFVMQQKYFSMPRAYAYLLNIKGSTFFDGNWLLHFAIIVAILSNTCIFIGTYFLFVRNQNVGDLVLNCIALAFCIEASANIADTRRALGPMGKAMTKASRRIDALMEEARGTPIHSEWNKALDEEPVWKTILLWPLPVSTTTCVDYVYCIVGNMVRLLGLFLAWVVIPYCM